MKQTKLTKIHLKIKHQRNETNKTNTNTYQDKTTPNIKQTKLRIKTNNTNYKNHNKQRTKKQIK